MVGARNASRWDLDSTTASSAHEAKNRETRDELSHPLVFRTNHATKPGLVDMRSFAEGHLGLVRRGVTIGALSARPELVKQLMPAIRVQLQAAAESTVDGFHRDMGFWWRIFDVLEERAFLVTGDRSVRLTSVEMLTTVHRQLAVDAGISKNGFGSFYRVAERTRKDIGLTPLFWAGPSSKPITRSLPSQDLIAALFHEIKLQWLSRLDSWRRLDVLIDGSDAPADQTEEVRFKNYQRFQSIIENSKCAIPESGVLMKGFRKKEFYRAGYSLAVMYDTLYPDAWQIRTAFLLCLAGSGWNPEVLLDLKVDIEPEAKTRTPFIEPHPTNPKQYVMRGFKARSGCDMVIGDTKTDRSPGNIIVELVERTWPLRIALMDRLHSLERQYENVKATLNFEQNLALETKIIELKRTVLSPWLHLSIRGIVLSLDSKNYRTVGTTSVLARLIKSVNKAGRKAKNKLKYMKPTDFRDAFAMYVWKATRGSLLYVMLALGQTQLKTAKRYVDNILSNSDDKRTVWIFGNTMWAQLKKHGIDATLLAKETQDGPISAREFSRLEEYRGLKRSRLKMGCSDPYSPPKQVAPNFVVDGVRKCHAQRCTICHHGVLLDDSLDGVAMRWAELEWQELNLPLDITCTDAFRFERNQTELALLCFTADKVNKAVATWTAKIESGEHHPLLF